MSWFFTNNSESEVIDAAVHAEIESESSDELYMGVQTRTANSQSDTDMEARIVSVENNVKALIAKIDQLSVAVSSNGSSSVSRTSSSSVTIVDPPTIPQDLANIKIPVTVRWRAMTYTQVENWLRQRLTRCVDEKRDDLTEAIYELQKALLTLLLTVVKARILLIFEEKNMTAAEVSEMTEVAAYSSRYNNRKNKTTRRQRFGGKTINGNGKFNNQRRSSSRGRSGKPESAETRNF